MRELRDSLPSGATTAESLGGRSASAIITSVSHSDDRINHEVCTTLEERSYDRSNKCSSCIRDHTVDRNRVGAPQYVGRVRFQRSRDVVRHTNETRLEKPA